MHRNRFYSTTGSFLHIYAKNFKFFDQIFQSEQLIDSGKLFILELFLHPRPETQGPIPNTHQAPIIGHI